MAPSAFIELDVIATLTRCQGTVIGMLMHLRVSREKVMSKEGDSTDFAWILSAIFVVMAMACEGVLAQIGLATDGARRHYGLDLYNILYNTALARAL